VTQLLVNGLSSSAIAERIRTGQVQLAASIGLHFNLTEGYFISSSVPGLDFPSLLCLCAPFAHG
jgi:hypothetical protein